MPPIQLSVSRGARVAVLACCVLLCWAHGPAQAASKGGKKAAVAKLEPKRVNKAAGGERSKKTVALAQGGKNQRLQGRVVAARSAATNKKAVQLALADRDALQLTHSRSLPPAPTVTRASLGSQMGLRHRDDPLELSASVAFLVDQDTQEVLFSKNESAVLPIASITKLMTGLIVAEAQLPMSEPITITQEDVDTVKGSSSRLAVGTTLSRAEMMHLALMSSENRAAHALGRTFPGGLAYFVDLMNQKARTLGMWDTRYVEPTGLSSANRSSARDLATLAAAAYERPILRELSTSPMHYLELGDRVLRFSNSNGLIHNPGWEIGLQKTGYISEAGRCLVMQARIAGRKLIMVLLDSAGKRSRVDDAERMRRWVEATTLMQWPERPRS